MLTHNNFTELFRIHDLRLNLSREDSSISFLPLSHVFERCWSLYMLAKGIKNSYLGDPKEILNALGDVRPTLMCSVPRLYQKAYHRILAKVAAGSNVKKKLFYAGLDVPERKG
jgi:long-chain acyl-CoA synthetase